MTTIEEENALERLISECFHGGDICRRELRLSPAQAGLIAGQYAAGVRPMGDSWYEITFQGALQREN